MNKIKTLLIALLSTTLWATPATPIAFSQGDGTATSPFEISTAGHLAYLSQQVNTNANGGFYRAAHYRQTADITLTGTNNHTPIGTRLGQWDPNNTEFHGVFDGNGHTIRGIHIDAQVMGYEGLFGGLKEPAIIRNVVLENVNIKSLNSVGGIAGVAYSQTPNAYIIIENCFVSGHIEGKSWGSTGGIVGISENTIIRQNYTTATVKGIGSVGGIVGVAFGNNILQRNVAVNKSIIATGDVNFNFVGRVVGYSDASLSNLNNFAWDDMPITEGTGNISIHGEGATLERLHERAFWTDLWADFDSDDNHWKWVENRMPQQRNTVDEPWLYGAEILVGDGSATNPFIIINALQLVRMRDNVNTDDLDNPVWSRYHYRMVGNIDLGFIDNWTPIGTMPHLFLGHFDGGGYAIRNLTITGNESNRGLFGRVIGETTTISIRNLSLIDVDISGDTWVGGIAGEAWDVNIENCFVSGKIIGIAHVGGIVGRLSTNLFNAALNRNISTAEIRGRVRVGGIVGYLGNNHRVMNVSNNVALNQSITRISGEEECFGRVFGDYQGTISPTNNYAWAGMQFIDGDTPATFPNFANTLIGKDGGDVMGENVLSAAWWRDVMGFTGSDWVVENDRLPSFKGRNVNHLPSWLCTHSDKTEIAAVPATCTTDGNTEGWVCNNPNCGETEGNEFVERWGHNFGEWIADGKATCISKGTKTRTCSRENCGFYETVEGDEYGEHDMPADWTERTAATCQAAGVEFKKCARCPHEITQPIARNPNAHLIVGVEFSAETCTQDGHTSGFMCYIDGCDYTTVVIIPAGHSFTFTLKVEPKCEVAGKEVEHNCIRCEYTTGGEVIPALGHNFPAGCQTECTRDGCKARSPKCGLPECNDCKAVSIVAGDKGVRHGIIFTQNPASDIAEISVILPHGKKAVETNVVIYDMTGNVVWAGASTGSATGLSWDLRNQAGRFVANGTYLVIAEVKDRNGKTYQYSAKLGVRR